MPGGIYKREDAKKTTQLSQPLLVFLMYTVITPGRLKEYCMLKYEVHGDELLPLHARSPSAIKKGDAGFTARCDHNTLKHCGCDHVVLSGHIQHYYHILCAKWSHNVLFVVSDLGQHTLIQQ